MTVIISYPYSTALFYWFAELEGSRIIEANMGHPYYKALFRESRNAVQIALAAAVVFEDFIIPAIDAPLPEGWSNDGRVPELGLRAEWEPVQEAHGLLERWRDDLEHDQRVVHLTRGLNTDERRLELQYSIADVISSATHNAPVICSPGRAKLADYLRGLGIFDGLVDLANIDFEGVRIQGESYRDSLETYGKITGLTFQRDSFEAIARVKTNPAISDYAREFRAVLAGLSQDSNGIIGAIEIALDDTKIRTQASGLFSTASRISSYASLAPGIGTVFGGAALALDATALAAKRAAARASWYELSPEIHRFQTLEALQAAVNREKDEAWPWR